MRVGALVLLISGSAAMAASEEYQVSLGPTARTNATRRIAVGGGTVIALRESPDPFSTSRPRRHLA